MLRSDCILGRQVAAPAIGPFRAVLMRGKNVRQRGAVHSVGPAAPPKTPQDPEPDGEGASKRQMVTDEGDRCIFGASRQSERRKRQDPRRRLEHIPLRS
jgi:hypothetical protein